MESYKIYNRNKKWPIEYELDFFLNDEGGVYVNILSIFTYFHFKCVYTLVDMMT